LIRPTVFVMGQWNAANAADSKPTTQTVSQANAAWIWCSALVPTTSDSFVLGMKSAGLRKKSQVASSSAWHYSLHKAA
jgi:hypothetical protein